MEKPMAWAYSWTPMALCTKACGKTISSTDMEPSHGITIRLSLPENLSKERKPEKAGLSLKVDIMKVTLLMDNFMDSENITSRIQAAFMKGSLRTTIWREKER